MPRQSPRPAKRSPDVDFHVFGTVRDAYQRPLEGAKVEAFDQLLRTQHALGKPVHTNEHGEYRISYEPSELVAADKKAADVFVRVSGKNKRLFDSAVTYNAPAQLRLDVNLSPVPYTGPSEFETVLQAVRGVSSELPLGELAQDDKHSDLTFLAQKTGKSLATITALAMAFRFEKNTRVEAVAWYGLVRQGPATSQLHPLASTSSAVSYDTQATQTFALLMQQDIGPLMASIQGAIAANLIPYAVNADASDIQKGLIAQLAAYQKANPPPTSPSTLTQKLQIAGLQGNQISTFKSLYSTSSGTPQAFWATLAKNPRFQAQQVSLLQSVFTLSQLTGEQMVLTDQLVKAANVQTPADLPKLAANTAQTWLQLLQKNNIKPPAGTPGADSAAQAQSYASELEANFTAAYPSSAFQARLAADAQTQVPLGAALTQFFQANPTFDLLSARIGQYVKPKPPVNGSPAASQPGIDAAFVHGLKSTQRVFKLAPSYSATNALLGDGLDSAQKIYRMGHGNFVAQYGPSLGGNVATKIFQNARSAFGQALMMVGNLKSMSDASHLAVFPNYTDIIGSAMTVEVPDLDTLFGHTDFCECDECNAVDGAPAYLADALQYLDNRLTHITSGGTTASVKEALLVRRPDLADLDLSCDNTNVEVPYIDLANELMEDFVAPPVVTVPSSWLPKLTPGPIDAGLQAAISAAFLAKGLTNVAALLTPSATLSAPYSTQKLAGTTLVSENDWIIRDTYVVLKASQQATAIQVQLTHQTLLTQDEISANPEYTNIPAYTLLKGVKRPFSLPFDLFETEGEMYLSKLGVQKADLVDAFRVEHAAGVIGPPAYPLSPAPTQADLDMAYASLGVNQTERTLIFVQDLLGQTTYWGPLATGGSAELDLFMAATSLTYEQVLQLLTLETINPAGDSVISNADLSCDTTTKTVTNLTPAKLDIIHRFLRLWRKTTLSLYELDALVQSPAVGNAQITAAIAPQLQFFLQLQNQWSLTVFQYLAFFQNLDTQAPTDLYEQLFQNRTATNPLNPDFAISQVTSASPMAITSVHRGLIMGALGLSPTDLAALIAKTDGSLSLRNLSYFFRIGQLAQALAVSQSDLFTFLDLINLPPITGPVTAATPANPVTSDPIAAARFFRTWQTVVTSQLSASDLNYVLRYQDDGTQSEVPSDDTIVASFTDLQTRLLQIQAATTPQLDPTGQLLKKWLTDPLLGWNAGLASKLLDILGTQDDSTFQQTVDNNDDFLLNLRIQYTDGKLTAPLVALPLGVVIPDALSAQVSFDTANLQLVLVGSISATDEATLLGLSADASWKAAVKQLFQAQTTLAGPANVFFAAVADINTNLRPLLQAKIPQRYALFLSAIGPVYRTLQQQNLVQNELCSWFKVNKDVASAIETSQPGIYTSLTDPSFVTRASPLTAANYSAQFTWYRKVALVCFVTGKLRLTATDLNWLLPHAAAIGSLDLWSLPTTPVTGSVTTFNAFQTLVQLLAFDQSFPPVQQVTTAATTVLSVYSIFDDVLGGEATSAIESDLSALTSWDAGQLDQLINSPNYLALTLTPAVSSDLLSVRILQRLQRCFQVMSTLGSLPVDCVSWTQPSLAYGDAVKIKQALQARTGPDQWLTTTEPLQNTLRQNKRDALVAYLLANPPAGSGWTTSDDLYSYFLIDVEMTSCQPTSRIVQATNAVQQFVQRAFLNLETDIAVDLTLDPDWSQWEWMKNYRVWQANREIFLYPENYIEPSLLPDQIKSPFFTELQSSLMQNAVTQDNVQTAYLTYLDSLDEVSRLEIKATWYEDDKQTLHVVGRTYGGDPKTYYYRTLVNDLRWTPWVKIDQDVASDHLVLTVFNHRIYLFWAIFTQNSDDVSSVNVPSTSDQGNSVPAQQPQKYWQVQLAFSEYKNGKWTAKKVSASDDTGAITWYQNWDGSQWTPPKDQFLLTPLDIPVLDFTPYFAADGTVAKPDSFLSTLRQDLLNALETNGDLIIHLYLQTSPGVFESTGRGAWLLDPCKGYPVVTDDALDLRMQLFDQSQMMSMLDQAFSEGEPLAVNGGNILGQTVGTFNNLLPLQMGFIDRLINLLFQLLYGLYLQKNTQLSHERRIPVTVGTFMSYVYQDKTNTYFVRPEISDNANIEFTYQDIEDLLLAAIEGNAQQLHQILGKLRGGGKLTVMQRFFNLFHPLVCFFMRTLFDQGIDALISRDTQLKNDALFDASPDFDFNQTYQPTAVVYSGQPVTSTLPDGTTVTDPTPAYPQHDVDFTPLGAYSLYNWELFFHAPLMIAEQLDQNLQFEDADHWYKYIFNPTDGSSYASPDKYWVTKPFFENVDNKYVTENINNIMTGIDQKNAPLLQDVSDWRNNPFEPHFIAQYRTVAYQKTTVMKYLDHLIAWGDNLFQQDTMESVMEAEQLYVLAQQILGPKPLIIPPSYQVPIENYAQLQQDIDAFSNALVDVENLLPLQTVSGYDGTTPQTPGMPVLTTLYFCVPPNSQLLAYWDTVANRLYNIRNCLNLQGTFAPLALFAPPINPMLLVRAAAAGLDIGSVLSDMNSPLPNYRYAIIVQKAIEVCNEAKSLGQALLSAMEKKDAEDLSLLKSKDGIALLQAVLTVKQSQVTEATHNLEALQAQQALIQVRITYYQGLISAGLNGWETTSLDLTQSAIGLEQSAVVIEYLGNVMAMIPDFDLGASGFGGSPLVSAKFGGQQLGEAARAMAAAIRGTSGVMHSQAGVASTQATYQRRLADWQFQLSLANGELAQIQKQILASQVRQDISNQDVLNQQLQISNAQAEDDFMHSKFSNTDLYSWMIGQVSQIYFQAYQLGYAWAKQAEQTFRYELGLSDSSYINFGYWDSLHKGLLASDTLLTDIRTMDKAYHDQNGREYELTKHISVQQLDPAALQQLKTTGSCWITLPEEIFDMDYPGQYLRRVITLAATMPCVAGPYTTVSLKLTMTKNSIRVSPDASGSYPRKATAGVPADDPRFRDAVGAIQAIATSNAQNDDGMFELNLHDERYLPFERAGAISQWHLELPAPVPQFDYRTISDIILHLKYTAREGGQQLAGVAATNLKARVSAAIVGLSASDAGLMRGFSVRHEFPTQWYAFLNPSSATADQDLALAITSDRFPYFASMSNIAIKKIELIADTGLTAINGLSVTPVPSNTPLNLIQDNAYGTLPRLVLSYATAQAPGAWTIKNPVANPRLTASQLNDLIVIVHYTVS